jgi:hypothetical protein
MAFNRLRDYLGRDAWRKDCSCVETGADCVGEAGGCKFMRRDTSRLCCDSRCVQGRDCPLTPQPKPQPKESVESLSKFAGWVALIFIVGWAALYPLGLLRFIERFMQ